MIQFIETTGRTEEDAIAAALFQLNMDRDDVSVEVLDRAKKGVFGFGGNPAKVRVSYEVEGEAQQETAQPEAKTEQKIEKKPQPKAEKKVAEPKVEKKADKKAAAPVAQPVAEDDDKAAQIVTFLAGLMTHMNVAATPVITATSNGYQVVLEGEELGALIGRRGETLDAIQQLTSYSVNRGQNKRVRIHIDAENYRARREEALCRLAEKVAGKVVKYRKSVTLESMNAYERHVIHTALQDFPGVATHSTGVEPNRRTVVTYAPENK